jgi:hypothetical protein
MTSPATSSNYIARQGDVIMSRFALNRCLRPARRLRRDESGASLLEMTVVTPFLLALGLGAFEFSNALYQYHLVTAGVRDAGRYLGGLPERDATARTNAKRIAVCGSIVTCTDADKRVNWWPAAIADLETVVQVRYCIEGIQEGDAGPNCPCDNSLGLRGGTNKVCVSTTATYGDLGFLDFYGLGGITITTAHEQRYFGVR